MGPAKKLQCMVSDPAESLLYPRASTRSLSMQALPLSTLLPVSCDLPCR